MNKSIFDLDMQKIDTESKIVLGLERIYEAFRVLLWDQAKAWGLSPIQIQILIFIKYHSLEYSNVSYLAKEFNMTKPTISDAIKTLERKGLIRKENYALDKRAYSIHLTKEGETTVSSVDGYADGIKESLSKLDDISKKELLSSLSNMIYQLNKSGIIQVQRTCFGCQFYQLKEGGHYCHFIQSLLPQNTVRLDCEDYISKSNE